MKCLHFIVFVLTLFLLETANSLAEEFNITTAASDTLSVDVENRDNISRGKLVFIQHGLATDRNHRVVQQTARAFADAGYVVVTFDSRHSLGKSGQDVENARLTTFEQDLERVYTLRNLGFNPYVMIYDKKHISKGSKLKHLQRWVNNRIIFRTCERFEDYQKGR